GGGGSGGLIDEDFAEGAPNFTVIGGSWQVIDGKYRITNASTAGSTHLNNRSIHNTYLDGDFDLTVDATSAANGSVWDDFGVIFGYQDSQNYYFFSSNESNDGGTNGIFRVVNG